MNVRLSSWLAGFGHFWGRSGATRPGAIDPARKRLWSLVQQRQQPGRGRHPFRHLRFFSTAISEAPETTLWQLFQNHKGRVVHKWKHYFPVYERHFARFIGRPVTFVEIGCGEGGSLQLWKQYLGPQSTIIGLDIRQECSTFEEDRIFVRIGDQSDASFLTSVVDEFGAPDIVVDDGSHVMSDIVASFRCLYPRVATDGVYVVEDLHTAYWQEYEGGVGRSGSFIELCKELIDELNAEHSRGAVPETEFSRTTLSMHFYDSIIVLERGSYGNKFSLMMGETTS